jgi:hypothetical protein
MTPLFNHLQERIKAAMDLMESEESVFFLEALKASLILACDPLDTRNSSEFKRVMLVIQSADRFLHSGAVPIPQYGSSDFTRISELCDISKLPTGL